MVGDMDNTGSLNSQIIHQLTSAVRSKIAIQVCALLKDSDTESLIQRLRFRDIIISLFECLLYFLCAADPAAQVCELAV